jgi:hypothetical protein
MVDSDTNYEFASKKGPKISSLLFLSDRFRSCFSL